MTIYHIVLVKFIPEATLAQKEAWKQGISSLSSKIPQIKELICGKKIAHAKDGGWDDGAILTFVNVEDLRTYSDAEPHRSYQRATADQTADKLIFDIEV